VTRPDAAGPFGDPVDPDIRTARKTITVTVH